MDMFSQINKIFTPQTRHAENTDTRQAIQRHEPDHERRKRDKKDSLSEIGALEDNAVVNVAALHAFLESFLKSLKTDEASMSSSNVANEAIPNTQNPIPNTLNSRAAQAYQTTAQTGQGKTFDSGGDHAGAQALLGGEDIRVIHTLLADLKILSERNIEFLQLEKAASFLGSISAAVAKTLSNP